VSKKKDLFWVHSTKSGLGDRLVDFFLMVSYAKANKACLNLVWEIQDNHTENQLKVWNDYRFSDYKIENLIQYFSLPKEIRFLESMEVSKDAIIFIDYLGGVHSVRSFYEKYCKAKCSLSHFTQLFFNELSAFKPQKKLLNIADKNLNIDIAAHLRRGDKISDKPDNGQIKLSEIDSLNSKTYQAILEINKSNAGSKKLNLFIASDDHNVKMAYIENLKDTFNIVGNHNAQGIESTYLDLYYLGISKVIIMSMKHSNFSLFASYVNCNKLIYFYKSNKVLSYSGLKNIELFKSFNIFDKIKLRFRFN
jgi:hypothetical protein